MAGLALVCGDTPPTSVPSLGSSDFRDPGEAWSLGSCGCGLPGPGRGRGTLWAKRSQSGFPHKLPRPEPLPPTSSAGIQATPFLDGLAGIRHARNGASCPPGPEALWFSLEPPSSCCRPQQRDRMVRQRTAVPPTPTGASTMLPTVPPTVGGQHLSFPPCSPAYCHADMGLIPWPALEETVCLLWGLSSSRAFLLSQGVFRVCRAPGAWLRFPPRGHMTQQSPRTLSPVRGGLCLHRAGRSKTPSVSQDARGSAAHLSQGPLEATGPGAEAGSPCCPTGCPDHQCLYTAWGSVQLFSPGPWETACLVILCSEPEDWRRQQRALRAASRPPGRMDPSGGQGQLVAPLGFWHFFTSVQSMIGMDPPGTLTPAHTQSL